jgi:hypothetical protein
VSDRQRARLKSPVREYCTPGSVRGAPGNRRPYLDNYESSRTTEATLTQGMQKAE